MQEDVKMLMSCDQCNKVLMVDDIPFNILSVEMMLDIIPYNPAKVCDKALDGKQGLEMMKDKLKQCCRQPYRIVIIDLNMPGMDGLEMMEKVQENIASGEFITYKDSWFILHTAQSEESVPNWAQLGFNKYIGKPLQIDQLESLIKQTIFVSQR